MREGIGRGVRLRWRSEWGFEFSILYLTKMKLFLTWNWNGLILGSVGWPLVYTIYIYGWGAVLCGLLIIKPHTTSHCVAVRFTSTCDAVRFLYFIGNFDWFMFDRAVWSIWWTSLVRSLDFLWTKYLESLLLIFLFLSFSLLLNTPFFLKRKSRDTKVVLTTKFDTGWCAKFLVVGKKKI